MTLERFSFGIGDRFGAQGVAQLRALQMAAARGVNIAPVWNKSNREHVIIGTRPDDTRREADKAALVLGWTKPYFVDADHIGISTVDKFLDSSNFFTIDVADFIGSPAPADAVQAFMTATSRFRGTLSIPGIEVPFTIDEEMLGAIASTYLNAVAEAGRVYRHICSSRPSGDFVTEISLDEAGAPQSPAELFFILAAIAHEGIALQTIAPKFSGSFLKGVDYVGDASAFAKEFEDDLSVIAFAVRTFDLPATLKLSVHSGSDKFSLYPLMHRAIEQRGAGLHLKTAGTTWLEEVISLAESGGDGLTLAKEIYSQSYLRFDELCKPYASVIAIDRSILPSPGDVLCWPGEVFAQALRHDQSCRAFNRHFRQLVHVGYKVAAEMGTRFTDLVKGQHERVGNNVTHNLFDRHIQPLFLGTSHQRTP